ncbi:MAG: YkoF family thiamine/hydroxymethylpyrimidine-binding protein [Saprospiraceae bacterium]|nr:YkoF family thiamine/hydroxymethylpyrimidine-binding protein [Saprospiraceae bacterium]
MQTTVEISMYPLTRDFTGPIIDFIDRLNAYEDLSVETNRLSTQVSGDYERVMDALRIEMRKSLERDETVVMVMKVLNIS